MGNSACWDRQRHWWAGLEVLQRRAADVRGARTFGEQAVVADAVQTFWQDVDEEAADELVGGERHLIVSIAALDAVVLPLEGDALLVEGDQAAVGDGDR